LSRTPQPVTQYASQIGRQVAALLISTLGNTTAVPVAQDWCRICEEDAMEAKGQCLCGAVRFIAQNVESNIHVCHCSICRRWSGGPAFATGVGSITFEGQDSIQRFDSSDWAERGFCKRCGSSLFYRLKTTDHYIMNLGAFDDQARFGVIREIYIDEKPSGYDVAGDHPRLTGKEFLASLGTE
jgi:hypothetical protein